MARSVNFQYKYPYGTWEAISRYQVEYDDSRVTLSRNYTYPLSFKKTSPHIVKAKIGVYASNVSGSSILNSEELQRP